MAVLIRPFCLRNLAHLVKLFSILLLVESTAFELFQDKSSYEGTTDHQSWLSLFTYQHEDEKQNHLDNHQSRSLKGDKKKEKDKKSKYSWKSREKSSKNIGFFSQATYGARVDPVTRSPNSPISSEPVSVARHPPSSSQSSSSFPSSSASSTKTFKVDEDAAANEVSKDWEFANSRIHNNNNEKNTLLLSSSSHNQNTEENSEMVDEYLMKYKKKTAEPPRPKRIRRREDNEANEEGGEGRSYIQRNRKPRHPESGSQSYADIQRVYAKRKERDTRIKKSDDIGNNNNNDNFMKTARSFEGSSHGDSDRIAATIEERDMEEMKRIVEPYLVQARVPGVIPRRDVVPQLRQDKMSTRIIKLFKRLLINEGIDLDGGEPGKKFLTRMQPCENDEEEYAHKVDQEKKANQDEDREESEKTSESKDREDAEEKAEKEEALLYGKVVTTPSGKKMCLKKRRQVISPSNFAAVSRTMNGSMPTESICKCVNPDLPVTTPLRWLHIPKCGTSLGMTLIYYACRNVPDSIEIRVHHAGIDPRVPDNIESDFNYKSDCLKRGAFVSRAGVVGSHAPLDYTTTWDTGLSKGKVVCFFRDPKQRIISAYWHAQHADGMSKLAWGQMRSAISEIEKPMLHWREKIAKITHAQLTREIPDEVIDDYRRAMAIYFNTEGVQGCMTKMIVGHRCAEQEVDLTPQLIEKAKDRLRHDFAFIGLTEEWDVSICLFHQMLGGNARELEFVNYRAGRASRSGSTAYDTRVLDGLVDTIDEDIYSTAKSEFLKNLRKFSSCPENAGSRFSSEHLLQTR